MTSDNAKPTSLIKTAATALTSRFSSLLCKVDLSVSQPDWPWRSCSYEDGMRCDVMWRMVLFCLQSLIDLLTNIAVDITKLMSCNANCLCGF